MWNGSTAHLRTFLQQSLSHRFCLENPLTTSTWLVSLIATFAQIAATLDFCEPPKPPLAASMCTRFDLTVRNSMWMLHPKKYTKDGTTTTASDVAVAKQPYYVSLTNSAISITRRLSTSTIQNQASTKTTKMDF